MRRLLREAARADERIAASDVRFQLRVVRTPAAEGLADAKRALDAAYKDWKDSSR